MAEAIPQIVWTANPDGWLDFYNQRWFDYTGLTLEQTQGWGWEPVLHPDDLQNCILRWTHAFSTGEPYETEYRFKRASDGEYRWHLGRALPVRDADGAIVKWFGTCTDIHDQKEAIEVLSRSRDELEALVVARTAELDARTALLSTSEQLYRRIVDTALNAIVAMDGAGLIIGWNPRAEQMFGWARAEAVGQRMSETIIPQRFREAHENGLKRFFETGEGAVLNTRIEITGLRRDGVEFPVELAISSPLRTSSGWMFNAFIRDLTERNNAAEAIRLERQRSEELEKQLVTLCAWSNTVMHDGEWMSFAKYLDRRFGLLTTHGISPKAMAKLEGENRVPAADARSDPKRLAAVKASGLLDTLPTAGFDRITRLGAAVLNVPATFISLVDEHRDFYVSHCGFGEPLASERQLTGQTFCHFSIQGDRPLVIPDTRADPLYAKVPTVESLGVAAYLGAPLVLISGEVVGAFCAIDFAPHAWSESQVLAATDLASLVVSEIELRQAAFDFQRRLAPSATNL